MRSPLPLLILAGCVCGCAQHGPEDKVTGSWSGDPPMLGEVKNDPAMRQFVAFLKDSYSLKLNSDHTYNLVCWADKKGTWKLSNRLIRFEETSSRSPWQGMLPDPLELGTASSPGKRVYSAVLSTDSKTLSLLMGKMGEVAFHR